MIENFKSDAGPACKKCQSRTWNYTLAKVPGLSFCFVTPVCGGCGQENARFTMATIPTEDIGNVCAVAHKADIAVWERIRAMAQEPVA